MKKKKFSGRLHSFKTRLILVTILFLVLGISLPVIATSRIFLNRMLENNQEKTIRDFAQTTVEIESLLYNAMAASVRIENDPLIDSFLRQTVPCADPAAETKRQLQFVNRLRELMQSSGNINSVLFFRQDGSVCGVHSSWNFLKPTPHPFTQTQIYQNAANSRRGFVWIGTAHKSLFTRCQPRENASESDLMIYGLRHMGHAAPKDASRNDTLLISLEESALRRCLQYISDIDSTVCLLDENGQWISGTDFSMYGRTPEFFQDIDKETQYGSLLQKTTESEEQQIVYYHLGSLDWTLVKITPTRVQHSHTRTLLFYAAAVGFFFVICIGFLYSLWAVRFTEPLHQVSAALTKVREGDLDLQIEENARTNEILMVQQEFNRMIASINELLLQKEKSEQEKLELEMRNLQAQIDPHFIYNSITSIRWMAKMAGADKVSDMLVVLTNLLRPIFRGWTPDWTLGEELDFADNYMTLMKMRYGTRLQIEIAQSSCLEKSRSLQIPRFTLQPILENCCDHGFLPGKTLHILLEFLPDGQDIIIRVRDDGAGLPPETLEDLNRRFSLSETEPYLSNPARAVHSNGIGLVNINRRLRLYYGDAFGLRFHTPESGGSCIEIRISGRYHASETALFPESTLFQQNHKKDSPES